MLSTCYVRRSDQQATLFSSPRLRLTFNDPHDCTKMPTLGGITAWISVGDMRLPEYGVQVEDDNVKCFLEVPHVPPQSSQRPLSPNASASPIPHPDATPLASPHGHNPALATPTTMEYTINWKIQDLTYTMAVLVSAIQSNPPLFPGCLYAFK